MPRRCPQIRMAAALLIVTATACTSGPPPSCGEDIGGVADPATFDQYFGAMGLVNRTTGQPGPDGEQGSQFAQADPLAIEADVRAAVEVRACVQPLSGGGELAFDGTRMLGPGSGQVELGAFSPGAYVVRVIVGGTLVKNLPFEVQ